LVFFLDALVTNEFIQYQIQPFLPEARFLPLSLQGCLQFLETLALESTKILLKEQQVHRVNDVFSVVAVAW